MKVKSERRVCLVVGGVGVGGMGWHSPDRLLGEVRTGEIDGVREEE